MTPAARMRSKALPQGTEVGVERIELPYTGSKPAVLPLYYTPIRSTLSWNESNIRLPKGTPPDHVALTWLTTISIGWDRENRTPMCWVRASCTTFVLCPNILYDLYISIFSTLLENSLFHAFASAIMISRSESVRVLGGGRTPGV